jgi:hypothetical protein
MKIAWVAVGFAIFNVTSAADAPVTALDRLAAVLPGTWKTVGQTFDSPMTKAGPQGYTTVHDCWREQDAYKCVYVVNGTLQLYDIFSWDAGNGLYGMTQITPQGRQPEFRVNVKDNTWTYDQDIVTQEGQVIHYRIVRNYTSALSADYEYEYSTDGKQWNTIAKGTDTRIDAVK